MTVSENLIASAERVLSLLDHRFVGTPDNNQHHEANTHWNKCLDALAEAVRKARELNGRTT